MVFQCEAQAGDIFQITVYDFRRAGEVTVMYMAGDFSERPNTIPVRWGMAYLLTPEEPRARLTVPSPGLWTALVSTERDLEPMTQEQTMEILTGAQITAARMERLMPLAEDELPAIRVYRSDRTDTKGENGQ